MKLKIKHLVILLALIVSSVIFPKPTSAQQNDVSFQVFYDALSPYGEWVDYRNYGYVWIPDAGPDFVPYSTAGYWVLTDFGVDMGIGLRMGMGSFSLWSLGLR